MHSVYPVELIAIIRDSDLKPTRPYRCGGSPSATMMDNNGLAREQLFVIDITNRVAVAARITQCEICPSLLKDRTEPRGFGGYCQHMSCYVKRNSIVQCLLFLLIPSLSILYT